MISTVRGSGHEFHAHRNLLSPCASDGEPLLARAVVHRHRCQLHVELKSFEHEDRKRLFRFANHIHKEYRGAQMYNDVYMCCMDSVMMCHVDVPTGLVAMSSSLDASACRVFCRYLNATTDEQLREVHSRN